MTAFGVHAPLEQVHPGALPHLDVTPRSPSGEPAPQPARQPAGVGA
jgi:hypothetical protein